MLNKLVIFYVLTPMLAIGLIAFIVILVRRRYIAKELNLCINDSLHIQTFKRKFSQRTLLLYSGLIEKIASHHDALLPENIGMSCLWIASLNRRITPNRLKRVLRFSTKSGLLDAFNAVLEKPALQSIFLNYAQEQKKDLVINALAKQAFMKEFDGEKALELLREDISEICRLSDSTSPDDRWFAYKILAFVKDGEIGSEKKWEAFEDHYDIIRLLMIQKIETENKELLYTALYNRLLNDPSRKIRKVVKEIIVNEYQTSYVPNFESLTSWQQKHFAENFDPSLEIDKKIAFDILTTENLELRLYAADFLNETNGLNKLIQTVDVNDVRKLNHAYTLLKCALEVYSDGFMGVLCNSRNPGALKCGAMLLVDLGDRKYIEPLAQSVFRLREEEIINPMLSDLYEKTLECIQLRGTEAALDVLKSELQKVKYDENLAKLILKYIPENADVVFLEQVIALIKNKNITYREDLLQLVKRMPQQLVVPSLIRILKSEEELPWEVRLNAIHYFKNEKLEFCFQYILENLELFDIEAQKEVVENLYTYSKDLFIETVLQILQNLDSHTSTNIILNLYVTGHQPFVKNIKKGLETSSAKIRYASITGLYRFKQPDFYETITHLMNDPDKDVRLHVAQMLATSADKNQIEFVNKSLLDPNELIVVKKSLLKGLGSSNCPRSEEILINAVNTLLPLYDSIFANLMTKEVAKIGGHLVELYPAATEPSKKTICQYFRYKGMDDQEVLLDALKSGDGSRKIICEILYRTGFIDNVIGALKSKSSELRSSALQKLLVIDTIYAHKGILLATRDNNGAIRMIAIEKFKELSKKQPEIIEELKGDSSKIVQKNILWLLNKLNKG